MTENNWLEQYKQEQAQKSQFEQLPKLKIEPGTTKFRFADNGKEIKSADYGDAILFTVVHNGEKKYWWVKKTRFKILGPISENMPVEGKLVEVVRVGKTRTDTRYEMVFLKTEGGN